jgi:hypothetical protein
MPAYNSDAGSADNLWTDGLHIYDGGDQLRGGGQSYVAGLVYNALKPAFDTMGSGSNKGLQYNAIRPLDGYVNKIKLYDGSSFSSYNANDQTLYIEGAPRKTITVSAGQSGGENLSNRSGFQAIGTISTKVTALSLLSNGNDAITFGTGSNGGFWGFAVGVDQSATSNYGRSQNGCRFKVPFKSYSRNGVIVEGRADTDATDRVLGIDIGATDSTAGTSLWSWNVGDNNSTYLVNGAASSGTTTIAVDTGTVAIPVGAVITFPGISQLFTVTTGVTGAGNIVITPALTNNVSDNTVVNFVNSSPQQIYHGRISDANVTNFTYAEPLAVTTIHVPVNATAGTGGVNARVIGVIPSYADATAGIAAVGSGEAYYDEATKKVKVKLT